MAPKKSVGRNKRKKREEEEGEGEWERNETGTYSSEGRLSLSQHNLGTNPSLEHRDFSHLQLKKDHAARPIWITPNGLIILEAFSPIYQQAYDFLVAIAEPVARPEYVHRYLLTTNSLYAAVAVSIETESIIQVLNRLCKTEVPSTVIDFIRESTATFGKAKLVLKDNVYHVESAYPDVLRKLLKNPSIAECRLIDEDVTATTGDGLTRYAAAQEIESNLNYTKIGEEIENPHLKTQQDEIEGLIRPDADEDDDLDADVIAGTIAGKSRHMAAFKVAREKVELVKKACQDMSYPLMEEYDFKNDTRNPNLACDLKPSTRIRVYQEKSLSKMFGNGRARSGIVVLPCGAGKSLTGVTAASTVKKSTMILCINNVSVKQWKEQLLQWTTIQEDRICLFTAQHKEQLPPPTEACVVLTTYTMLCFSGQRAEAALPIIESIKSREWGLMILDEVHVAPASKFRTVLHLVNAHCKMGLTATLVREDDLIEHLNFLIGPKLYEANWMDLTQLGYLANVQCCEIWCPMTAEYYREYLRENIKLRISKLIYILNPNKFRVCEYLVRYHEARGDKIIIFSDDVIALKLYSESLNCPFIYGETTEDERRKWLYGFKNRKDLNCIGLSKVGDTALDIPEANVIIQVSSHFGARRQEAQRLGRILRPKAAQLAGHATTGFNAFFYTLVSCDTREMYFSAKRQQYLVDQGYTFKVIQDLVPIANRESTLLKTKKDEMNLLNQILNIDTSLDDREDRAIATTGDYDLSGMDGGGGKDAAGGGKGSKTTSTTVNSQVGVIRRKVTSLGEISGGNDMSYMEYNTTGK